MRATGVGDSPHSPYQPVGVNAEYKRPPAGIDPNSTKKWWRRILPLLGARRWPFIFAIALSFLSLVFQVQVPNLLNQAIDKSIQSHAVPLSHYVEWIIAIGVAGAITGFTARWLLFRTAYDFEFDLRNLIYEHLSMMSFSFYDRVQSGQLISRANSDIRSVQMYATFAPLILVQCAIGLVAFGFMLAISVPLAFVAMAIMPVLFWVGVRMRNVMFPVSWIIQARLADVATIVDENINGVRVVKSFAQEGREINNLADASEGVSWAYVKDADLRARYTPALQNLPQVGLALVLLFGGAMVIQGKLGIGAILAFNAYLLMLQAPFMMLGMLIMMGQRAAASAERIFEVLDERPDIVERPGAYDLEHPEGRVEFTDVHFSYEDGPTILDGLNLTIQPGESVALVGRTGSGKSTIARLLLRFYDVDQGSVAIDGHDVRDLTLASLRAGVGVVLDDSFLFSISIADNIAYGRPSATPDAIEAAAKAAHAHDFIMALPDGYQTVVGERGYTLSGGQRQRLSIARALLVNPPILILDDATSAIDVRIEQTIHQAFEALFEHRTTLIVAHRLSTIALADRVALVENGKIIATGTHESLLAESSTYAEVLAQVEAEPAESQSPEVIL